MRCACYLIPDFSSATANLTLDLTAGTEGATGSTLAGIEAALGGAGSDAITGDGNLNWLDGRAGDDTVRGLAGNDTLRGGAGRNVIDGGDGGDDVVEYGWAAGSVLVNLELGTTFHSGGGGDTILGVEHASGGAFDDTIDGGLGANYLDGGAGDDNVFGGDGRDTIAGGQGADTLDGGGDTDLLDLTRAATGLWADLDQGVEYVTGSVLLSMEGAIGSGFDDHLDGDLNGNWLDGRSGNDSVHGFGGNDTLTGGLGFNDIEGGDGDADVVLYNWMAGPITVDLEAGSAVGAGVSDFVLGVEVVVGTASNDLIKGSEIAEVADNYFQGGAGDDTIDGGGGGDDTIASGDGQDRLVGGSGVDLVDFGAASAAVFVDLAAGIESGTGTVLTSIEQAIGSNFADTLTGDANDNWLSGGTGNDTLDGGRGNDSLIGGAGADLIEFEAGDGYDAVFGFETGVDVIDASAYSADPAYAPNIFEYGNDLVIAFQNGDNLYLVGESLSTFNAATDLRL